MTVRRVLIALSLPFAALVAFAGSASAGAPPSDTSSHSSSSSSHKSSDSHDCSGARKVIHVDSDRDHIDANDNNTTWLGGGHRVGYIVITGHCVTVRDFHVTDRNHPGIAVEADHVTVEGNQVD